MMWSLTKRTKKALARTEHRCKSLHILKELCKGEAAEDGATSSDNDNIDSVSATHVPQDDLEKLSFLTKKTSELDELMARSLDMQMQNPDIARRTCKKLNIL